MAQYRMNGISLGDAYFAVLNPLTGEYTRLEPSALLTFHCVPNEGAEEIKSIHLTDYIGSFTITATIRLPYSFWWRNVWQRGITKAIRMSPVPDGNPRDN